METADHFGYTRLNFGSITGYVVSHPQRLITIGHTASIPPWSDPTLHCHDRSEEFYFLLKGQLEIQVQDFRLSLHAYEILMVDSGIPHAIVGGRGRMEHFGLRAPALDDKRTTGKIDKEAPFLHENGRLISGEWGHRMPLDLAQHKNCWLIGAGSALFESRHLTLAYLDFPTQESANAGIGIRHQLHLHQRSWEYYVVLAGEKTLQIGEALIPIQSGELLAVPPNVKHALHSRRAPYRGLTLRVPVELDDKIVVET